MSTHTSTLQKNVYPTGCVGRHIHSKKYVCLHIHNLNPRRGVCLHTNMSTLQEGVCLTS